MGVATQLSCNRRRMCRRDLCSFWSIVSSLFGIVRGAEREIPARNMRPRSMQQIVSPQLRSCLASVRFSIGACNRNSSSKPFILADFRQDDTTC